MALAYAPATIILGKHFENHLVLAHGLSFAGISTGQLVMSPLLCFLVTKYGWRGALFIMSAVYMHLILSAFMYRPRKKQKKTIINSELKDLEENNNRQRSMSESIRKAFGIPSLYINPHFLLTILSINAMSMTIFGCLIFLIPRAEEASVSRTKSAFLISCVGIGGMIGRLVHGIAMSRKYITMIRLFMIAMIKVTIEMFLIPLSDNYTFLIILSVLFGVSSGMLSPLATVIPREVVRLSSDLIMPAIGVSLVVATAGQSIGGLIAGKKISNPISWLSSLLNPRPPMEGL